MNLGGGGCGELRSCHCIPAWVTEQDTVSKKKKEKEKRKIKKKKNSYNISYDTLKHVKTILSGYLVKYNKTEDPKAIQLGYVHERTRHMRVATKSVTVTYEA